MKFFSSRPSAQKENPLWDRMEREFQLKRGDKEQIDPANRAKRFSFPQKGGQEDALGSYGQQYDQPSDEFQENIHRLGFFQEQKRQFSTDDRRQEDEGERAYSPFGFILLAGSFLIMGILGWSVYRWISEGSENDPPLILPEESPFKVHPDKPGGVVVPHQDKLIYGRLGTAPVKPHETEFPLVERLLPAPEDPVAPEASPRRQATVPPAVGQGQVLRDAKGQFYYAYPIDPQSVSETEEPWSSSPAHPGNKSAYVRDSEGDDQSGQRRERGSADSSVRDSSQPHWLYDRGRDASLSQETMEKSPQEGMSFEESRVPRPSPERSSSAFEDQNSRPFSPSPSSKALPERQTQASSSLNSASASSEDLVSPQKTFQSVDEMMDDADNDFDASAEDFERDIHRELNRPSEGKNQPSSAQSSHGVSHRGSPSSPLSSSGTVRGQYRIQLATFAKKSSAEQEMNRLKQSKKALLARKQLVVEPVFISGVKTPAYRIVIRGFDSPNTVTQFKDKLMTHGLKGTILQN